MRSDYCPISGAPCQALCETPCSRKLVRSLVSALKDSLALIETLTPIEGDTVRKARAALDQAKLEHAK